LTALQHPPLDHAIDPWSPAQRARLVRLCAAVVGPAAAEDVAQEALLEAWRQRAKLVDATGAEAWLGAIARNVCRRHLRKHGNDRAVPTDALPEQHHRDLDHLEREDVVDLLERALALLPAATSAALVGHYVDELSHAEIAERIGATTDAVSMRVSRGRAKLRHLLETEFRDQIEDHQAGGWRATRLPCAGCGRLSMELRRDAHEIALRCRWCDGADLSSRLDLRSPVYARLIGGVQRPTAIQTRIASWTQTYWSSTHPRCVHCDGSVTPRRYAKDTGSWAVSHGWFAECDCGESVSSSVTGLVLALPEVREARRREPKLRLLPVRDVVRDGQPAKVVALGDSDGTPRVGVVVLEHCLRIVHVDTPTT
jgi:RNA polymerase sigma factor (sigma-70 family)